MFCLIENDMRNEFFKHLPEWMNKFSFLWCLTGDLGYIGFDVVRKDYSDRFINCKASEQAMLDIACGLALSGKMPLVYSITPFLIYRPFETLRTYINHEKIPIKMVGGGRDTDYKIDGWSHHATDVKPFLDLLPNIKQYWPNTIEEMLQMTNEMLKNDKPCFLSLHR